MESDDDEHRRQLEFALAYAENIIATLRGPFVVLDNDLRARTANAAFYPGASFPRKMNRRAGLSTTWATAKDDILILDADRRR